MKYYWTNWPTNRLTNRPTDQLTIQPTDQSINRSIHLSIYIHLYTYIHFFFHSWFHCWQKHEREEHVVAWKTCNIHPHFLHYMNCSKNYLKSLLSSTLSCLSSGTIQEKSNKPKQKGHTCLKSLQHSPEWQNHRKEEQICFNIFAAFFRMIKTQKRRTSDWKNWFHYIKWQKHKIRTHCCLQKLTPF